MEKAGNLTKVGNSTQQNTSSTKSQQITNRFWARMAAIYPANWSRNFKTEKQLQLAQAEWGRELEKLSLDDISHGLEKLKSRESAFPPSLPEFLLLCKNSQKGLTHNTTAYTIKKSTKRLEKKTDIGKARVHLNTIKESLK